MAAFDVRLGSVAKLFAICLAVVLSGCVLVYASGSATATASATVPNTCSISITVGSTINFGSVAAGSSVPTDMVVTATDSGGNYAANILVLGTAWTSLTGNTFGVSNTLWSPSTQATYTGTALTTSPVNTNVVLQAPTIPNPSTSNSLYFGLGIPSGTPADSYSQTITLETAC